MRASGIFSIAAIFVICIFFGVVQLSPASAAERLTYVDLVNRLTDLGYLATLPGVGEKCAQWSSYDRRSKYDSTTGKYVDWAANGDGDGIIKREDGRQVFAEIEGPAVIWRIWSALAGEGNVKIYLDGNEQPAVDLPFDGYFNCKNEPFTRPALVHTTARGRNCYVPIPFQKSCKIVGEEKWGAYYHFTYTKYPEGTVLPTFKRNLSAAESRALDKANEILSNPGPFMPRRGGGESVNKVFLKVSGDELSGLMLDGPGAITTVLLYTGERSAPELAVFIAVLLLVLLLTLLSLLLAPRIMSLFGETGANVLSRVLGVLLAALAVQFVLDGVQASLT